jgi:hypothetical protein
MAHILHRRASGPGNRGHFKSEQSFTN